MNCSQPLPTLVNLAEQQSKLAAAALTGEYTFPDATEMERVILEDEKIHLSHFYASKRHTIQVDFGTYCRNLSKEIERGARRIQTAG